MDVKNAPSRSLDDRYRYIRPGANPNGTEVRYVCDITFVYLKAANVSTRAAEPDMCNEREHAPDIPALYLLSELNCTAPDEDATQYVLEVDDDTYAPDATELEITYEIRFGEQFLENIGVEQAVLAGNLQDKVLHEISANGWGDIEQPSTFDYMQSLYDPVDNNTSYPGLRQRYLGASPDALRCGESPIALFFHFMLVPLWQHIAVCSNEYRKEMVSQRVEEAHKRYKKRGGPTPRYRRSPT
ncbi:hypothetical protein PC116_g7869 [Phytophthora cactorum]|nr:hypothetical protein PC116_g7869 [Phytophthora cactorum]